MVSLVWVLWFWGVTVEGEVMRDNCNDSKILTSKSRFSVMLPISHPLTTTRQRAARNHLKILCNRDFSQMLLLQPSSLTYAASPPLPKGAPHNWNIYTRVFETVAAD